MRVYLLNPPAKVRMVREGRCMQRKGAWTSVWPPVTLCTIAAMFRNHGFEVRVSDFTVETGDIKKLREIVLEFQPDLVFINTATGSIVNDLSTATEIKSVKSDTFIAALGIHVSALPEESLNLSPHLDALIRGEPEFTAFELGVGIAKGRSLSEIKGISFRRDGEIVHNRERGFEEDLNNLPFPAWDLIDTRNYLLPFSNRPFLLVTTSKGCRYSCTFCPTDIYYGHKIRLRSPEVIGKEIEWVKEKTDVEDFLFWTESFTLNRDFAHTVCDEIIKRNLNIRWVCNSRVDDVDLPLLRKFRQAGCWMIGYGVESGSQEVLNRARKGITVQQTIDACKFAKVAGLEVTAHVIFGLPGETKQTALETIKFVNRLDVDYGQFYCAVPFPGCELYEMAKANNWLTTTNWTFYEQNFSVLNLSTVTAKEVAYFRKRAFKEFYLRPKIVLKHICKINNIPSLVNFLRSIREFLTWV